MEKEKEAAKGKENPTAEIEECLAAEEKPEIVEEPADAMEAEEVFSATEEEKEMLALLRRMTEEGADRVRVLREYGDGEPSSGESRMRFRTVCFMKTLDGYRAGCGADTEKIDEALRLLLDIIAGFATGGMNIGMVEHALKAIDFDRAVKESELKGRNAVAEAKIRKSKEGDGVPHIPQSRAGSTANRVQSIFDLAGKAK